MAQPDPAAIAFLTTFLVGIATLYVFWTVRADWRRGQLVCICRHKLKQHVSALDWDSNYGNPGWMEGAVAASYRKPGTCRDCGCRHFIHDYRA